MLVFCLSIVGFRFWQVVMFINLFVIFFFMSYELYVGLKPCERIFVGLSDGRLEVVYRRSTESTGQVSIDSSDADGIFGRVVSGDLSDKFRTDFKRVFGTE